MPEVPANQVLSNATINPCLTIAQSGFFKKTIFNYEVDMSKRKTIEIVFWGLQNDRKSMFGGMSCWVWFCVFVRLAV